MFPDGAASFYTNPVTYIACGWASFCRTLFELFLPSLPGVGSSREQVNRFDEQLEVVLVPALPSAGAPAGLLGAPGRLPGLNLGVLLLLQLGVHFLYLMEHTRTQKEMCQIVEFGGTYWALQTQLTRFYLLLHCCLAVLLWSRGQDLIQTLQTETKTPWSSSLGHIYLFVHSGREKKQKKVR